MFLTNKHVNLWIHVQRIRLSKKKLTNTAQIFSSHSSDIILQDITHIYGVHVVMHSEICLIRTPFIKTTSL